MLCHAQVTTLLKANNIDLKNRHFFNGKDYKITLGVCGYYVRFFAPIFNDRFLKKILHLKKFKISIKEQKKRFESWKKGDMITSPPQK